MTKKTIQKHEEDYFHIKKTTILKTGVYIILQLITLYMLICFLCGVDITTSDVFYWDTFGNFLVTIYMIVSMLFVPIIIIVNLWDKK